MAIHFTEAELAGRRAAAQAEMAARGLAGMLLFRQESMFYLTGYDTFGYCFFQCLYLGADGRMALLTRAPDLLQARHTSVIGDIRIWEDRAGSDPAEELRAMLEDLGAVAAGGGRGGKGGGAGERLGIELDAYGLNARDGRRVEAALAGRCTLEDASDLVSGLRAVKSEAEMAFVRRAAELADDALEAALELARPGAFEGDILAAMHAAVFRGGGDYPGNGFIIGSGEGALLVRYFTGRRHLSARDQLTLEHAGAYRHYHAALMRTVLVGGADPEHERMHAACAEALRACTEALRPGRPVGEAFDAQARALDAAGYREHRLNACGYSLGATYAPTWMDRPMLHTGNPVAARPGMVFFLHMILADGGAGRAMSLGHTVEVTGDGCAPLSRLDPERLLVA